MSTNNKSPERKEPQLKIQMSKNKEVNLGPALKIIIIKKFASLLEKGEIK